jgi:hypothetical protein
MRATIPATPRARYPLLAIALCLLIVLTSCGSPSSGEQAATSEPTATQPTEGETPSQATPTSPAATPTGPVYGPTPLAPPASPVASPVPVVRAEPVDEMPDTAEQWAAINLTADETGVYGYVVLEDDGTVVASINGTTPFITASTYKLILMADILWRVESGMYDLDDTLPLTPEAYGDWGDMHFTDADVWQEFTIQEYLYATGAWSSNAAARTLLTLTNTEMLRMTAKVIGMEDTYLFVDPDELPNWPPPMGPDASSREEWEVAIEYLEASAEEAGSVNISTPLDMARYQMAVINDTLISPWVSQQVGDILAQQALRDGFPHFLDGLYPSFNKPGNLPDAANDVGGIFLPEGPRAVAIMALAVPDVWWTTLIHQRLALIATGDTDYPSMPW